VEVGKRPANRQTEAPFRPLVAFDFDGTLTWRDSFRAFLAWRSGPLPYALGLARLMPDFARYLADKDRGALKSAMVRQFIAGVHKVELERDAARFAAEVASRLFRPDALACWRAWRSKGARLVVVTASPETIVAPFARGLGAERLIGTRLAFDDDGKVLPYLGGPNCRGRQKTARLREVFGPDVSLEAAYGDSDGDIEMLDLADERGFKAFGGRP
jgi:phosphatidylglycerophosphatase C